MSDAPQIDLDAVGELVASAVDGGVTPAARLAGRERLVRAAERPAGRGAWLPMGLGVLAVAAAVVLWWAWPRALHPPAGGALGPIAARTSAWLEAPATGVVALPVGDGAVMSLHDGARGRVSVADDAEVGVVLETGTLHAEVDPAARRQVVVEAGPHRVHVVGTVFAVVWSPDEGRFEVEVTRGKVEVRTPTSSAPIAVDAGRRLVAGPGGEVKLAAIVDAAAEVPAGQADTSPEVPGPTAGQGLARGTHDPPSTPPRGRDRPRAASDPVDAPSWESLAKAGKYAEALALVEAAGFDDALASLSSVALEELADVARLAGRTGRADAAYLELRARFPGTAAAARAAFQLGRLAADSSGKPRDAVRWLEAYLAEAPQGSFARLARGRLLVALRDAGDRTAARAAARVYLDSYPDGPHAKIADALLASP